MKAVVPTKSWKSLLENNDDATLWQSLHRLVSIHPLIRSAQRNQHNAKNTTSLLSLPDLTQDLYLLLLEKSRFKHYLQDEMSDTEIEREIFQVELTNMLIGTLRRKQPENYRIVRRISGLLESDPRFKIFRSPESHQTARYRQAVNVVYGLREWNADKSIKDVARLEDLMSSVPSRIRNRRRVGCKGDAQVIVTNQELVELLEEIFKQLDSPISLRTLRTLALSKLPIYDAEVSSIDQISEQAEGSHSWEKMIVSENDCPEGINLRREEEMLARRAAHDFLAKVDRLTRFQPLRTEKFWRILWHYYFDPSEPSQLVIADMVGMSDSSVSDYRRKMEQEMQKHLLRSFTSEQLSCFAEELSGQLKWRLTKADRAEQQKIQKKSDFSQWGNFSNYSSLASFDNLPAV